MKEELVKCSKCGDFVSPEEAHVIDYDYDDDWHTTEIYHCKDCYDEEHQYDMHRMLKE